MRYIIALLSLLMPTPLVFSMELSFVDCYFKLLPFAGGGYDKDGKTVLMKAVSYDNQGKVLCPKGKQKEFIVYLIEKKKLNVNETIGHHNGNCFFNCSCTNIGKSVLWFAAETGNRVGVEALVEHDAADTKKHQAIAAAVHGWKRRKEIKGTIPVHELDASYLAIIKFLLSKGFCPDGAEMGQLTPLEIAFKKTKELPGLFELLSLHATYRYDSCKFNESDKISLRVQLEQVKKRYKILETDKTNYLSLLVPDMQQMVASYIFKTAV